MRRFCVFSAVVLALLFPATALAETEFGLAGVEIDPSPATFVGKAFQDSLEVGGWFAEVPHSALSNDPATPATICTASEPAPCGAFALATAAQTFTGAFLGGTITFAALVSTGDGCPDETYTVQGILTNGSFGVRLRHHRKFPFLGCPIVAATVRGATVLQ